MGTHRHSLETVINGDSSTDTLRHYYSKITNKNAAFWTALNHVPVITREHQFVLWGALVHPVEPGERLQFQ